MRFNPKPLIEAVKASMDIPKYVRGVGQPVSWPRPPLRSRHSLRGMALAPFTKVAPSKQMEADELVQIAEQFIQTFVIPRGNEDNYTPSTWLVNQTGMKADTSAWVFPRRIRGEVRDDVWRNYTILLWWISNAGHPLKVSPSSILATIGDYEVGVVDSRIVSFVPQHRIEVAAPDWQNYLTGSPQGASSRCTLTAWNKLLRSARYASEAPAVQDALLILHARGSSTSSLVAAFYDQDEGKESVKAARAMQKMADDLEYLDEPYMALYRALVPRNMSEFAFHRMFPAPTGRDRPDVGLVLLWKDLIYEKFGLDDFSAG